MAAHPDTDHGDLCDPGISRQFLIGQHLSRLFKNLNGTLGVGATLTGAQFGVRGLAVSIAWGEDPVPWDTPVSLAVGIIPTLAATAPATVLNLNVPAVPSPLLRGLRHGSLGSVGLIRSVRPERTPDPVAGPPIDRTSGVITLALRGMGVAADRAA